MSSLELISAKTDGQDMPNQPEKALPDYQWPISGALEDGREDGREEVELTGKLQVPQE